MQDCDAIIGNQDSVFVFLVLAIGGACCEMNEFFKIDFKVWTKVSFSSTVNFSAFS